jgi:stigma-specific protein Stig1
VGQFIDDVARALARGTSRRTALRRIGGGLAAIGLTFLVPKPAEADDVPGNPGPCAPPKVGVCHNTGSATNPVVFTCVAASAVPAHVTNHDDGLLGDLNNCSKCGDKCSRGQACCNGKCTPLNTTDNCGKCGDKCPAGQGCCNGACTPLNTTANCGTCGNKCPDGQICESGKCVCPSSAPDFCGDKCLPKCPSPQVRQADCSCKCTPITCPAGQSQNPTTCVCECPTGTTFCGGRCVNSTCPLGSGQTFNPTTCSCQCPSGQAPGSDGVCTSCGTSFSCGSAVTTCGTPAPGGICACLQAQEGFTACGENFTCGTTPGCTTSASCVAALGPGAFCQAAGTGCCGAGVCVPACGTPGFATTPAGLGSNIH